MQKAFVHKEVPANEIIEEIIILANIARKEGLLSLEEYGEKIDDDFFEKGYNVNCGWN